MHRKSDALLWRVAELISSAWGRTLLLLIAAVFVTCVMGLSEN